MIDYIEHPLIKKDTVEKRLYQLNIAGEALEKSSLVVLPTGLGKTIIALLVMITRLSKYGGRVLLLSPTKPLVEQHALFLKKVLEMDENEILTFTGNLSPENRVKLWDTGTVIVSTPQVIENDLIARRVDLTDFSHITFDEAHRAVGNYAYTYIAEKYFDTAKSPHILAITASPGSSNEKVSQVCESLRIESVIVKTEIDPDVVPYIHKKNIEWINVDLPADLKRIKDQLERILNDRVNRLKSAGFNISNPKRISKTELLNLQKKLQSQLRGYPNPQIYTGLSLLAEIMKVNHAIEVAETQGIDSLKKYIERLENEAGSKSGSKASKRLCDDLYMRQVSHRLKEFDQEHPKIEIVKNIVSDQLSKKPESRVIVFTNYRDTAEMVTCALEEVDNILPIRFVGQGSKYKDKGLSQKQQVDIIKKFRDGSFNVLVATSVAEEGLDIPATDLVLFYEPVPSEIRSIQRKGRTGRKHEGRVVVLVTKGTRDEGYYWSSKNKELRMQSNMKTLTHDLKKGNNEHALNLSPDPNKEHLSDSQCELDEFNNENDVVRIIADQREGRSTVLRSLDMMNIELEVKTLEIGDYIISDRCGVERKDTTDFVNSLLNKTLFEQISNLSRAYEKPILIIEGNDLFTARKIHPSAIHGSLASISFDFNVSVFSTRDAEDTATLLHTLARREQVSSNRKNVSMHGKKSFRTLTQQQEYIVSSIPEIGPKAARNLLLHFGSIEGIVNATKKELMDVSLIGPKTAQRIRELFESQYKA
ncbi:DEAD/DEAH box helicase [Methanosalsum natronophilum]|uniref:DEAD/DEAH box helicase n=1 Tax=Methanosalsum natronophilum TaxID=768733 RepID=UPI002167E83D|nr:DEAD/DEAH box helicase [Methanosalsum natronophilum]MCS3923800.1 Fanconi anemia group M protein [Methanosalsum natronophilum]